jgi:RimJ/RimL family protein N-acetyltransferase
MEPVYLRALEVEDLERTHKWHNDPDLYSLLTGTFRFVSMSAERKWLEKRAEFNNHEVNWAICESKTKKHIGNVYLREISWVDRRAGLAIFIGEKGDRSKGYGQSAVKQLLRHAFGDLNLRKVTLPVLASNTVARHIYEKCGFTVEGTLRRHVFKNGRYEDVLVMAVFADDASSE